MKNKEQEILSNLILSGLNNINSVSSIKGYNNYDIYLALFRLKSEGLLKIVTHDEQGYPLTWEITDNGMEVRYIYGGYTNWKRSQRIRHKVSCAIVAIFTGLLFALICKIFL